MYEVMFQLQARIIKALGQSRRLEIIHLLQDQELPVTQIYQMLDLPQANVSQHLLVLREAGILAARRKGKQIHYRVSNPIFVKTLSQIRQYLSEEHRGTQLADEFTLKMNQLIPVTHDPVCQMRLSPKTASFAKKYNNLTYYFCASGCLKKFKLNPTKYA